MTTKVRVQCFTISLDGFGAGSDQGLDNPLGRGGLELHGWLVGTRTFQKALFGNDGGSTGIDDDFAARGFQNIGAWVLGRNMFGPIRGPWPDESWKGWWGDNPPYHCPVFILTRHPRKPVEMEGGTVFHFVTEGLPEALRRAREAARGQDVRVGGGVATIQQCLSAALIDEMHLAISPVLLGAGERLFAGVDMVRLGYECAEHVSTPNALHIVFRKKASMRAEPSAAPDYQQYSP
jgi:dihydrofolate reductase